MTIQELLELAQTRLGYLSAQRQAAWAIGDVEGVSRAEAELAKTTETILQLRSLLSA